MSGRRGVASQLQAKFAQSYCTYDVLLKRYLDAHLPADHLVFERPEPNWNRLLRHLGRKKNGIWKLTYAIGLLYGRG
jgi:hypothetical protein